MVEYVPAISETDPDAAMTGRSFAAPNDHYTNPGRGAVPQWVNRFPVLSWAEWLTYDPITTAASRISMPTLKVHSEDAAVPAGARAFYDHLAGPKQILWTTGSQLDLYDQQVQVSFAIRAAADHFAAHL